MQGMLLGERREFECSEQLSILGSGWMCSMGLTKTAALRVQMDAVMQDSASRVLRARLQRGDM